ncbi:unnamed protein product [Gadus morhua 'NCC']
MSTGWEQDLFDVKAAVLARAEGRSIPTGTGGDSYGFTFDQVTALDPVAQSPSTLAGALTEEEDGEEEREEDAARNLHYIY